MKLLSIDFNYYHYPTNITCIEEFIAYANDHYNSFIELTQFETDNCVFPYFVSEDTARVFINIANIEKISEVEGTVLSRAEYDDRLRSIVEKKCINCIRYEEDSEEDNLEGHRDKISLDGKCYGYHKKEDE